MYLSGLVLTLSNHFCLARYSPVQLDVAGLCKVSVLFLYERLTCITSCLSVCLSVFFFLVPKQIECSHYHLRSLCYKGSNSINCFGFFPLDYVSVCLRLIPACKQLSQEQQLQ